MFNFNPETKYDSPNALVPNGTLAFAVLKVRGVKQSQSTGGTMADVELTIADGPYARRKVWTYVLDPTDGRNSEEARKMGMGAIQHALEAGGFVDVSDRATYERFNGMNFRQLFAAIDGARVAIKIGVEAGKNGHQDKNKVAAWLTPNPNSGDAKQYRALVEAVGTPVPAGGGMVPGNVPATQGFGSPAPAGSGGTPDWL
jgi:hypothetical protein